MTRDLATSMSGEDALGVDIGGVIIELADGIDADGSMFSQNYLSTPAVAGAVDALSCLAQQRFGPRVHLISVAGSRTQARSLEWLDHRGFWQSTGISRSNVHFCRKRCEKAIFCEILNITHFVDDNLDVLLYMKSVERRYLLNASPDKAERARKSGVKITPVVGWKEVLKELEIA